MYLFFNREKEPFRMEKGRSLVTNIDRKGKWRPDTGGDKKINDVKKRMLTILWLLPTILWEQKKTQIKKKKRNEEKNRNQVWNLNTEVWYLHKKVDKAKNEVYPKS